MRIVVRQVDWNDGSCHVKEFFCSGAEKPCHVEGSVHAEEVFRREIELLVRLFFEDPELLFSQSRMGRTERMRADKASPGHSGLDEASLEVVSSEKLADLWLTYALGFREAQVMARVEIADAAGHTVQHEVARPAQEGKTAQGGTLAKEGKRPLQVALLEALSRYTGIRQPWGVLTGVRPVKLYHRYLERGEPRNRIAELLEERFVIGPEKIRLMDQITRRQLEVLPDLYDLGREVSIYVGIPFCPTKCAYCTFPAYSIQGRDGSVEEFLRGLHEEIERVGSWLHERGLGVTTVYVGGGTPTSISAAALDHLLAQMARHLPHRDKWREWTVEAGRPDTITPEKLDVLKKWRVDRISINPQSFTQETLQAIGRHHTIEETLEAYHLARQMGMNNINMDLIIGLPGEGLDTFRHSLEQAGRLRPESLTVHTLSFKRASTMTKNKSRYRVAERDEAAEMVRLSQEWTAREGYVPYYLYRQKNILGNQENVGYALPGKECLYNILIMEERQTILGLGCGAVSKVIAPSGKITRYANPKEPGHYNRHYREYIEGKLKLLNEQLFALV